MSLSQEGGGEVQPAPRLLTKGRKQGETSVPEGGEGGVSLCSPGGKMGFLSLNLLIQQYSTKNEGGNER